MKCMTCKYATDKDKGALKCHRFPKAAIVSREYWCGEYQEEGNNEVRIDKKPTGKRLSQDRSVLGVNS